MGTRCRHTGRRLATSWGLAWQRGADCQGRSAASHGGDCARRRRVCPEMRESGGRKGVGEGANASSNVPSSVATIRVPWACFILGRPAGTAQGPGGHSLALEVAVVDRGKLELGVHLAACKPTAMQRGLGLLRALQGAKLQVHKALHARKKGRRGRQSVAARLGPAQTRQGRDGRMTGQSSHPRADPPCSPCPRGGAGPAQTSCTPP